MPSTGTQLMIKWAQDLAAAPLEKAADQEMNAGAAAPWMIGASALGGGLLASNTGDTLRDVTRGAAKGTGTGVGAMLGGALTDKVQNPWLRVLAMIAGGGAGYLGTSHLMDQVQGDEDDGERMFSRLQSPLRSPLRSRRQ